MNSKEVTNTRRIVGEAILSAVSDAIVAADKDGRIVLWNPGAERIFGYRGSEALGRSLDIIIPERLRKPHWEGYARVMNGGRSRYDSRDVLAVPAVTNDGSRISIEFTIVPCATKPALSPGWRPSSAMSPRDSRKCVP